MARSGRTRGRPRWQTLLVAATALGVGCTQTHRRDTLTSERPRVVVLAPVLNLTGTQDFDSLKVTDLLASELLSFKNVALVPVNLTLAELQRRGQYAVETPQDAAELARSLGADATVVVAIHEYNPYDPPVIGLTMQWYAAAADATPAGANAVPPDSATVAPRWQIQRVFNAATDEVREDVRSYAREHGDDRGPYGWQRFTHSQDWYVRYCGWASFRTMLRLDRNDCATARPYEAKS